MLHRCTCEIFAKRKLFNHAACPLAGTNLTATAAEANRIQMRRQPRQKLLNNIPSLHSYELYTARNGAVTARSMHFTTSSCALLSEHYNMTVLFIQRDLMCLSLVARYGWQTDQYSRSSCWHVPTASLGRGSGDITSVARGENLNTHFL